MCFGQQIDGAYLVVLKSMSQLDRFSQNMLLLECEESLTRKQLMELYMLHECGCVPYATDCLEAPQTQQNSTEDGNN